MIQRGGVGSDDDRACASQYGCCTYYCMSLYVRAQRMCLYVPYVHENRTGTGRCRPVCARAKS